MAVLAALRRTLDAAADAEAAEAADAGSALAEYFWGKMLPIAVPALLRRK